MRKQQERRSGRQWLVAVLAVALGLTVAGCSASVASNHEHEWEAATCETPRVCKTCGETDGEPMGHTWQEATCLAPKTCTVCGKTEGRKSEDHVWGKATCTEREKCVLCGRENLHSEPLGHDWIAPTLEAPYTCARCGEQQGEPLKLSAFNRGHNGKWEAHPTKEQYVGMNGYVAVTHKSYLYPTNNSPYENNWYTEPWYATTYEKDKQFFNPVGTVEHKTPVTVIGQELTDWQSGVCCYYGFLFVERVDNGDQFYISVTDFVTEPYWETTNANDIGYTNPCLAVYHQCSDYYPTDRNGRKYDIADGEVVLILEPGKTGENAAPVDVAGRSGRGSFQAEDLTVIY